jgi:hypothetical protein
VVRRWRTGSGAPTQSDGIGVGSPFIGLGEGRRGGEGGVTAGDVVVFNDRVILGSSRWVKA